MKAIGSDILECYTMRINMSSKKLFTNVRNDSNSVVIPLNSL